LQIRGGVIVCQSVPDSVGLGHSLQQHYKQVLFTQQALCGFNQYIISILNSKLSQLLATG